ncbi:MAG: DEAD/DEAH box helicase family protein, partial [bacterium]|nr:DEAD/DEAH box helicase family protein [bacterium]
MPARAGKTRRKHPLGPRMTDLPTSMAESKGESRSVVEGSSAGGISLEPPGPTPSPREVSRVPVPTKSVVVVHDATRPSPFRLAIGFVLVCAAVLVCSTPHDVWRQLFGERSYDQYARAVAGALLALFGGLGLRSSILHFLHFWVTSVLVCGTVIIGDMLIAGHMPWRWLILGGVALAYLIHASGRVGRVNVLGMVGWILVGTGCIGSVLGWFDFSRLGAWLGGSIQEFFDAWGTECTWGTVLLLTAIGVSWSRTRPIDAAWVADYERRVAEAEQPLPPGEVLADEDRAVTPTPIRAEALAALTRCRTEGRGRALVVMATGLGKTFLAAFDVLAWPTAAGRVPRVLFLAHRRELLTQAAATFRRLMPTAPFGWFVGAQA